MKILRRIFLTVSFLFPAGLAQAACPIPVWVNDGAVVSETKKNILAIAYNNAILAANIKIEHDSTRYLGATERSNLPRSQALAKLPPEVQRSLPPENLRTLQQDAIPPTDYTPPLGSVSFDSQSRFEYTEKAKRGFFYNIERRIKGLDDWKVYDSLGGNPTLIAQDRIRQGTDHANQVLGPIIVIDVQTERTPHPLQDVIDKIYDRGKAGTAHRIPPDPDCEVPEPELIEKILEIDFSQDPWKIAIDILRKIIDEYARARGIDPLPPELFDILIEAIRNPGSIPPHLLAKLPPEYRELIQILNSGGRLSPYEITTRILGVLQNAGVDVPPELYEILAALQNPKPDIYDLIKHLPPEMQDALLAARDPKGILLQRLPDPWKTYAYCLQGRNRDPLFLAQCLRLPIPREALLVLEALENPEAAILRNLPPELLRYVLLARDPKQIVLILIKDFPPFAQGIAIAILSGDKDAVLREIQNILSGLLGQIRITLTLPVWQPLQLKDPLQWILDLLKDAADKPKNPRPDPEECKEIEATEPVVPPRPRPRLVEKLIPNGPNSWRSATQDEIVDAINPPGNNRPRQAPVPPDPKVLDDVALNRIPKSLPVHGAPYPGGFGSPISIAAVQYDSAERSLAASGLASPDYYSPGIEAHAIYAIVNRPLEGWAATPHTDQPKTSTDKPPSTAAIPGLTDRFYAEQPTDETPLWHLPLVEEARETYLIDTAADAFAIHQESRNNEKLKEQERDEIFKNSQKCEDSLCDLQHTVLLQVHLAELETEHARLQISLLNLETAERLNQMPFFLP